jgi:hypothetical protein
MKKIAFAALVAAGWVSLSWSGDSVVIQQPVHLDTPDQLAHLRDTNPDHYTRATHILAAANRLCPPGAPKVQEADLRSNESLKCGHTFLTSNPPKRRISFTLDGTQYVALVTITASPARAMSAE